LWLADCLESNGQTASAWEEFIATATMAAEREDPREGVARARAEALFPRLSRIVFVIPVGLGDLEIACDGLPVPSTRWISGSYVDPGVHHLVARDAGRAFWEADVSIGTSPEIQTVALPMPSASSTSFRPAPVPVPVPAPARGGPERSRAGFPVAAASTAGLGLIAIGFGIYFGLDARNDNDASNAPSAGGCGTKFCSADAHDLRTNALHDATASDVTFIVGGAAVLAGVLLYVFTKGRSVPPSTGVAAGPTGLRMAF
jgi:hypothetical protein